MWLVMEQQTNIERDLTFLAIVLLLIAIIEYIWLQFAK